MWCPCCLDLHVRDCKASLRRLCHEILTIVFALHENKSSIKPSLLSRGAADIWCPPYMGQHIRDRILSSIKWLYVDLPKLGLIYKEFPVPWSKNLKFGQNLNVSIYLTICQNLIAWRKYELQLTHSNWHDFLKECKKLPVPLIHLALLKWPQIHN